MSAIDFTNLAVTLAFLAGPVGIGAWAIYWSSLFRGLRTSPTDKIVPLMRRFAVWVRAQSDETAQFVHVVGAVGVPGVAYVIILIVPPATLDWLQPHYAFITLVILSYIGGQFWYLATKEEPAPTASATANVSPQGDQSLTLQVGGTKEAPVPAVVDTMQYGTGAIDPKS